MNHKDHRARDAFSFSLGGITSIASFAVAPAIADDRINRARDERLRAGHAGRKRQEGQRRNSIQGKSINLSECA